MVGNREIHGEAVRTKRGILFIVGTVQCLKAILRKYQYGNGQTKGEAKKSHFRKLQLLD
jgi:hypothetical protein